jgi:predicted dithiol-disulfide oxidoreductase (DUF899 family)
VTADTEADQIAAARHGDDAAFERLVAAHQARLHAYCYRMLGSVHDADDALQETLLAVSFTQDSVAGGAECNFRAIPVAQIDPGALPIEGHGLSAFAREDGVAYHTYSVYVRGCDVLWGMWQWLDRAPLGRNEGDMSWFHRHDEYPA